MRKDKDFIDILHKVSEAERTVLLSAIKKSGVFWNGYDVLDDNGGIILFDGNFLYPLGKIDIDRYSKFLGKMAFSGILGSSENVSKILKMINKKNWITMKKDFAILKECKQFSDNSLSSDLQIDRIENRNQLKQFCALKSEFLLEEFGQKTDPEVLYNFLENCYSNYCPVLLTYQDKAVGMVSSNFSSDESSMINMLFIKKDFRGYGYGQILLKWYVRYLLEFTKTICLFSSPENIVANKIYKKIGFKKTDEWLMALNIL